MPRSNFSQKANDYDSQASVQLKAAESLIDQALPFLNSTSIKAADLGCGTGAIGKITKEKIADLTLNNCDISEPMLQIAQESLGNDNFTYSNSSIPDDSGYDLITSNFALQWYDDLNSALESCIQKLNSNGILAISLPIEGSFTLLRSAFKHVDAEDSFFKFPHLDSIKFSLSNCEILLEEIIDEDIEFNGSFEVFKNLHTIGANQKDKKLPANKLRKLIRYHDELFDGKIIVTYKILKMIVKRVSQ